MRILAGDIGGTNTRLSLFDRDDAHPDAPMIPVGPPTKFKNADFPSLDAILERFAHHGEGVTDACFGIAGPVEGRSVKLTNIAHWPAVHADDVARRLAIDEPHRVNLLNDMPAHAASIASIEAQYADHVLPLRGGTSRPTGTRIIAMAGTGLGIGMLIHDPKTGIHRPVPAEAGHADLPTRDADMRALVDSMRELLDVDVVTREHAISGPGLRAIYACLSNPASPDLAKVPRAETFGEIEANDPVARRSLDLFARLFGELAGNAALEYLATGGIYLAGSIANSLRPRLASSTFRDAFARTGPTTMRSLVESIPVRLITFEETGLLGAATYATWAASRRV